jgi:hypothetical protein
LGSYEACYGANARALATLRSLRILNRLQQRDSSSDQAPALDELGLPPAALIDPFSGQNLLVRRTDRGWIVYSVGTNLQDDGGQIRCRPELDLGFGPLPNEPSE